MIPRSKMADIYMEMLMTDQWINDSPGMRMIADTSLVYEPILDKYGYDKLDYIYSVDHYMHDPERFSRILRTTAEKLDKRIKHLHKLKRQQELEAAAAKEFEAFLERFQTDYSFSEYFPYLNDEPYVHYYDSLTFEPDTLHVYRLMPIERADTLYDRLEMIVRVDTLAVSVPEEVTVAEPVSKADVQVKEFKMPTAPKGQMPVVRDSVLKRKDLNNRMIWQEKE